VNQKTLWHAREVLDSNLDCESSWPIEVNAVIDSSRIDAHVNAIVTILRGISFADKVIAMGFRNWLDEYDVEGNE